MGSPNSTTLVIVGDGAPTTIETLDRFANVSAARLSEATDDDAQRFLAAAQSPYVVHDRDPLCHVAAAWVEFFDDLSSLGVLELEVDRALGALEHGGVDMPDYYVVVGPERLSPTWKHWWLGVLPRAAPTRVIPWDDDGSMPLSRVLRTLPTSRPWPAPGPWLNSVKHTVPDARS
jgi:hypothetical protein